MVFNTLYLQLLGFTDFHASLIASMFLAGTAIGAQVGGYLGDLSAKISPNHGRVLVAQFSVGIGVPMSAVVYKVRKSFTSINYISRELHEIRALKGLQHGVFRLKPAVACVDGLRRDIWCWFFCFWIADFLGRSCVYITHVC